MLYQNDFLCRNYGIFVLPAVVHFEDGVPNIYEGFIFLPRVPCLNELGEALREKVSQPIMSKISVQFFNPDVVIKKSLFQEHHPTWQSSIGWKSKRQRLQSKRL